MINELVWCVNCAMQVWDLGRKGECPNCGNHFCCDLCGETFGPGETQQSLLLHSGRVTGHIECVAALSDPAGAGTAQTPAPAAPLLKIAEPEGDDYTPPPPPDSKPAVLPWQRNPHPYTTPIRAMWQDGHYDPPPPYEHWEQPPPKVDTEGHFTEGDVEPPQQEPDTELAPAVADYLRELGLL